MTQLPKKMKFKINLDYKVNYKEGEEHISNQQVTQNYIIIAVHDKYPKGLDGTYRRIFGRIIAKFDEAIDKNLDEIDLEQSEVDLLKNAVREAKFSAPLAYNANLLEDSIEAIK